MLGNHSVTVFQGIENSIHKLFLIHSFDTRKTYLQPQSKNHRMIDLPPLQQLMRKRVWLKPSRGKVHHSLCSVLLFLSKASCWDYRESFYT